eukprot:3248579-Prymnesium_polylepis.1
MPQSRSAPPATLKVMIRELMRSCGQGRPREEIGESAVLARSGSVQCIGTTLLHPPTALVMLSRAQTPTH